MRSFHAPPVGAVINRRGPGGRMGRRPAASGFSAPAGGLVQRDAPPISLLVLPKEKWAVHGPKRKNALVATLHVRAKLLYGSRRIGACADFASPSGTLFSSTRSILPSRGGWCGGRRGGRRIASAPIFAAAGLAVDGNWCGGRMPTSAPTEIP